MKFNLGSSIKKLKDIWETDNKELLENILEAGYDDDYETALEYAEKGIHLFGNKLQDSSVKARFWELKSIALKNLDRFDESLEAINQAIKFDKKNSVLWLTKEDILHELEKYDESLEAINKAISLAPKELKDELLIIKAHDLTHQKKFNQALTICTKFLKNNPNDIEALLEKSEILFELGKIKESLKVCEDGLSIDSDDSELLFQKGYVSLELKKYEDAIDAYDKVTQIDPTDDDAWYNKACALSLLDKKEEALDSLTVAISLDLENITDSKTEKEFENIKKSERFNRLINQEI